MMNGDLEQKNHSKKGSSHVEKIEELDWTIPKSSQFQQITGNTGWPNPSPAKSPKVSCFSIIHVDSYLVKSKCIREKQKRRNEKKKKKRDERKRWELRDLLSLFLTPLRVFYVARRDNKNQRRKKKKKRSFREITTWDL